MQCRPPALGPSSVSVSVVLHDPLLRMGVLATLRDDPRFSVRVVEESSGVPVEDRWDACLSGLNVLVTDYEAGLGIAEYARRHLRAPRILIVTQRDRESEIRRALRDGILGYILVGCGLEEIISGVLSVHEGRRHLGRVAARRIADSFTYDKLTSREADVLSLVVEGLSNKAVARHLRISVGTVKAHVRSIFGKLGAKTRTQAAAEAQRRGLVEVTESAGLAYPINRPIDERRAQLTM
jgi:DNA-binding NarL/FixJ family response regulator